jgi:putative endonuclease
MFYVYILYSLKCDRYYVGYSSDPQKRLNERHNQGKVTATKNCAPYIIMASKEFPTELDAIQEERRIKKMKSKIYLQKLIKGQW